MMNQEKMKKIVETGVFNVSALSLAIEIKDNALFQKKITGFQNRKFNSKELERAEKFLDSLCDIIKK